MTTLRDAAQQALDALEDYKYAEARDALRAALVEDAMQKFTDVNQELMAALGCDHCNHPLYAATRCRVCGRVTEPVQEPVAWRWGYRSVTTGEMDWRGYVEIAAHPNLRSPAIIMEPLYASPPQRKPLTEGEISNIWDGHVVPVFGKNGINPIVFARAIEAKHGIGEQQ